MPLSQMRVGFFSLVDWFPWVFLGFLPGRLMTEADKAESRFEKHSGTFSVNVRFT